MSRALFTAAALFVTAPAAAKLPIAGPADVVTAVRDCRAATGPTGVDAAKLRAAGWQPASVKVATPLRFYGRKDVNAVLMYAVGGARPLCTVNAGLTDRKAFPAMVAALDQELGIVRQTQPGRADAVRWLAAGQLVQLDLTGAPDAPLIGASVTLTFQEKK